MSANEDGSLASAVIGLLYYAHAKRKIFLACAQYTPITADGKRGGGGGLDLVTSPDKNPCNAPTSGQSGSFRR